MKTTKPKAAAAARIGAALGRRKRAELLDLLRPCFARTEPWLQAGKYAAAVMCDLRRRNGWTIAERSGDRPPDRTQRLLNRAAWDTWAAMGVVRRFAVAGLDEAARTACRHRGLAVGAIDETGQVKAGTRTAGVKSHPYPRGMVAFARKSGASLHRRSRLGLSWPGCCACRTLRFAG